MDDIVLSVIVPTYGHELYIRKALDSILMQKVNFRYEILVGEDASPDGTRKILEEYEANFPDLFKMFYRSENMYSQPEKFPYGNSGDLKKRSRGKYIITLEGDDYWSDENKLQKQVDFLEAHPEYIAVAHNTLVVNQDGERLDTDYPECKENIYSIKYFASDILPGQTTTIMYRNFYKCEEIDASFVLDGGLGPGDRRLVLFLLTKGKIFCMQQIMSAYRYVLAGGTSYSANYSKNVEKEKLFYTAYVDFVYRENASNDIIKSVEMIYFRWLFRMKRKNYITKNKYKEWMQVLHHPFSAKLRFIRQFLFRKVLHKKIYY